jgi:hypothetical protein
MIPSHPSATIQILPAQTQISFSISTPSIIDIPLLPVNPFLDVAHASSLVNNVLSRESGIPQAPKGRQCLAGRLIQSVISF